MNVAEQSITYTLEQSTTSPRHSSEGRSRKTSAANPVIDSLDIWSSVIVKKSATGRGSKSKISSYGIQKLRELILELAVRGKLVSQNSDDEPASVLLKNIIEEKAWLIKKGKIKKQNLLQPVSDNEKPFLLPLGWEWCRLGNIGFTQTGGTPKKANAHHYGKFIPFLKPANILEGEIISYDHDGLSEEGAESLDRIAQADSVLMVCIGTIGKCARIDRNVSFNQQINSVTPYAQIGRYISTYLQAPIFQQAAWNFSASTTIAILNKGKWANIPIAIPPEQEQHRIVTKVDELMELCDQLEQQQTDSLTAHQTLVETLLNALIRPEPDEEGVATATNFEQAWQRITEHFDTLFTTEHSIDQLKQTILQLAVMGKLVPQNPDDEPASVLLEKIAKEKTRLIKEGEIKKQKVLPEITEEEKTFGIPIGWVFARLQNVIDVRDGTHDSPKDALGKNTYPLVTSKNFSDGNIDFENARRISETDHLEISKRSAVEKNDILFSMIGGNLGNQVMVKDEREFSIKNVALFKYYDREITSPFFIKKFMEHLALDLQAKAIGGAQPFVSLGFLRSLVIALPPVEEQHRIVTKVDELMTICDALKARLQETKTTQMHLADAVVEQAVG